MTKEKVEDWRWDGRPTRWCAPSCHKPWMKMERSCNGPRAFQFSKTRSATTDLLSVQISLPWVIHGLINALQIWSLVVCHTNLDFKFVYKTKVCPVLGRCPLKICPSRSSLLPEPRRHCCWQCSFQSEFLLLFLRWCGYLLLMPLCLFFRRLLYHLIDVLPTMTTLSALESRTLSTTAALITAWRVTMNSRDNQRILHPDADQITWKAWLTWLI